MTIFFTIFKKLGSIRTIPIENRILQLIHHGQNVVDFTFLYNEILIRLRTIWNSTSQIAVSFFFDDIFEFIYRHFQINVADHEQNWKENFLKMIRFLDAILREKESNIIMYTGNISCNWICSHAFWQKIRESNISNEEIGFTKFLRFGEWIYHFSTHLIFQKHKIPWKQTDENWFHEIFYKTSFYAKRLMKPIV